MADTKARAGRDRISSDRNSDGSPNSGQLWSNCPCHKCPIPLRLGIASTFFARRRVSASVSCSVGSKMYVVGALLLLLGASPLVQGAKCSTDSCFQRYSWSMSIVSCNADQLTGVATAGLFCTVACESVLGVTVTPLTK
jgi:hypothetical protein